MAAFQPGKSGNPKGRPKSYKGVSKLRDLISVKAPELVARLLTAALDEGDTQAARLLIERALPALKPIELPVSLNLPDDGLADQGRAVIAALANGQLAPGQAGQILAGLGAVARLVETQELEKRIAALEGIDRTTPTNAGPDWNSLIGSRQNERPGKADS